MPRTAKSDKKPQTLAFIEAARELGCNEDESRFNVALAKIVRAKPADPPAKKPKPEKAKPDQ